MCLCSRLWWSETAEADEGKEPRTKGWGGCVEHTARGNDEGEMPGEAINCTITTRVGIGVRVSVKRFYIHTLYDGQGRCAVSISTIVHLCGRAQQETDEDKNGKS